MEKKTKKIKVNDSNQIEADKIRNNIHQKFYLTASLLYPKEEKREHIVNFRQILYKGFLQDEKEERQLESALMTSFGFEFDLVKPIVETSVKVNLLLTEASHYKRLKRRRTDDKGKF